MNDRPLTPPSSPPPPPCDPCGKRVLDALDRDFAAAMITDMPLLVQLLMRGQLLGKRQSLELIELVRIQQERIERLEKDRDEDTSIDERDRYHEVADSLALAISEHFRVPIGEHSNMNCPWSEASKILNGEYVTDTDEGRDLKKVQARFRWVVLHAARLDLDANAKWRIRWDTSTDFSRRKFDTSEEAIDAAMAATESPA